MLILKAKIRNLKENLEEIRKSGFLPAVFYGMGNSSSIAISAGEFKKVWRKAGETSAVQIDVEGKIFDVLIQEVQVHPVTDEPIHVDFLVIDMNKTTVVEIPLEFIGISEAVKSGAGTLVKVLHEITIEALPKDLPKNIEVNISKLATTDDQILAADLILPKGVQMITKESEVVASIALQKEEVEEVAPVDLSSIEVEKKGKKEEEAVEGNSSAEEK
jgi:large subunit ribosomal protein L25